MDHCVQVFGDLLCEAAQCIVEGDFLSSMLLSVVEMSRRDACLEHFLQAEGLGAELDFVRPMGFGLAALILDGKNASVVPKFHYITLAGDAERKGADGEAALNAHARASLGLVGIVGALVEDASGGSEEVLLPDLLQMNQRTLPRAKEIMLQGREGKELVFCI